MKKKRNKKFDTTFEADEAREKARLKQMIEDYHRDKQLQEVADDYWGQTWSE